MKRLVAGLVLSAAVAALSGCYVDPGYSYVRQTSYQGDAYYGQGVRTYDDGYYYVAPAYGRYGGGYGYGYGCCYAPGLSVGISGTWYGGSRYRDDRRVYRTDRHRNDRGYWRGQRNDRRDGTRGGDTHRADDRRGGNRRGDHSRRDQQRGNKSRRDQ